LFFFTYLFLQYLFKTPEKYSLILNIYEINSRNFSLDKSDSDSDSVNTKQTKNLRQETLLYSFPFSVISVHTSNSIKQNIRFKISLKLDWGLINLRWNCSYSKLSFDILLNLELDMKRIGRKYSNLTQKAQTRLAT
jgi:hypothetical protein